MKDFFFYSSVCVRTGKLFTSIFTKSSPAGTFLSDSELLPNTEKNQWEELLKLSYDRAPGYLNVQWTQCQEQKQNQDNKFDEETTLHFFIRNISVTLFGEWHLSV